MDKSVVHSFDLYITFWWTRVRNTSATLHFYHRAGITRLTLHPCAGSILRARAVVIELAKLSGRASKRRFSRPVVGSQRMIKRSMFAFAFVFRI